MYRNKKPSPESPKAVSYFNQFPSNFLKPYGKADDVPDQDTLSRRTKPISCEWYLRPRVALSEFAETVTENLKLLTNKDLHLVDIEKFASISEDVAPMLHALSRLNTKTKEVPNKEDITTVMSYMYDNTQMLDKNVEEMFRVGGAMFTTAIQYIVARSIMSNPTSFSEKLVLENENSEEFKGKHDVKGLRNFLQKECLGNSTQSSSGHTSISNARRALLQELEDDDSPEPQTTMPKKTGKHKRTTLPQEADESPTPKRKKSKRNKEQ